MILRTRLLTVATALASASLSTTFASSDFSDPSGGWDYIYEGNNAFVDASGTDQLDGAGWTHDIGSDALDHTNSSATQGIDGSIDYLDLVDGGGTDPFRKVGFGYDIDANDGTNGSFLDNGFTATFRLRTTAGYPIRDNGKGMFNFHQNVGTTAKLGFTLTSAGEFQIGDGTSTGSVDLITGLTASNWNEFWVTVEGGTIAGRYDINVYLNGSTVAAYTGTDVLALGFTDEISGKNHVSMQLGSTAPSGDVDIDFFGWTAGGAFAPVPEPSAYALLAGALALGAVAIRRRRS